ncbi:hypothetical protein SLA2020_473840 [Shorea laevis]
MRTERSTVPEVGRERTTAPEWSMEGGDRGGGKMVRLGTLGGEGRRRHRAATWVERTAASSWGFGGTRGGRSGRSGASSLRNERPPSRVSFPAVVEPLVARWGGEIFGEKIGGRAVSEK